jgi:exodeoxyribonuclease-3
MRIATGYITGRRARLDFVVHWLRERQPDVVGLQELKLTDEQFPADAFESEGYTVATHGQKAWNGVAILSRKPATIVQRGLPGQEDFGARLITAEIEGLSFTTVYCPNGKSTSHEDFPKKLAWFDALADWFGKEIGADRQAVLCGDLNIVPEAIDSYDETKNAGHVFHTDEERDRLRRVLDLGLVDVYRALNPETQAFSWWDYRGGAFHRGFGLRIDFLLATESAMSRVESVEIDREYRKKKDGLTASDHAPVLATLR